MFNTNIWESWPAPTLVLAQVLIVFVAGLVFGKIIGTTDWEFAKRNFGKHSFRSLPGYIKAMIICLPFLIGFVLWRANQFYDNVLMNWILLVIVTIVEFAYFMLALDTSNRTREMIAGCIMLLASWPTFSHIGQNLYLSGYVYAMLLVRLIVLTCTVGFVIAIMVRICRKDEPDTENEVDLIVTMLLVCMMISRLNNQDQPVTESEGEVK